MSGYVYILECKNGRYYIGSTNDIKRRRQEHVEGRSTYTKHLRPLELVYLKTFDLLQQARIFEKYIKKQKEK